MTLSCAGEDGLSRDGLTSLQKKQRKARTAFSDGQLSTLETSFERQKYLSVQVAMVEPGETIQTSAGPDGAGGQAGPD